VESAGKIPFIGRSVKQASSAAVANNITCKNGGAMATANENLACCLQFKRMAAFLSLLHGKGNIDKGPLDRAYRKIAVF